jgi:VWFA-related protein
MGKPWNLNKTWFTSVSKILSLFLMLAVMATGCGGGGGGSSGGGGDNDSDDEPFDPPAGIITKIVSIDTEDCPEVTVYFSVNDQESSEPVRALTDQNFLVTEDGDTKAINAWGELDDVSEPIVFSLVLDYSVSVTDQDLVNIEDATTTFVNELFDLTAPFLNWGEITKFARNSEVIQNFTDDRDEILDGIVEPYPDRGVTGTNLYDAIYLEIEEMVNFRANSMSALPERSILIVVTDGKDDNKGDYDRQDVTDAAIDAGVEIVSIGFGDEVALKPLFNMAIDTKGLYFYASTSDDLDGIIELFLVALQHQYWVLYDSSDSAGHTVEVEVTTDDDLSDSDSLGFACP